MVLKYQPKEGARNYKGPHYDEPNVVAHTRLVDRTGPNGEKVLHMEEIQSDWHQQGRKRGYETPADAERLREATAKWSAAEGELRRLKRNHEAERVAVQMGFGDPVSLNQLGNQIAEAMGPEMSARAAMDTIKRENGAKVPDAPWKKDWHEMVLKHVLKHAVDNGYDAVAVTPGEDQVKRYDLSKHIGEVHHSGSDFVAYSPEGKTVIKRTGVRDEDLPGLIGQELSQKLLAQKPQGTLRSLTGQDLQVGGEGMKGFYDRMVPMAMDKLGKPYGAQVTQMPFTLPHPTIKTAHVLDDLQRRGRTQAEINAMSRDDLRAHMDRMQEEQVAMAQPVTQLHTMPITDSMRQSVKTEGLPLFAKGGVVDAAKNARMPPLETVACSRR
jgi:hypothetical protein